MNKDTQSWSNSNLTEMEELLQKVQQLETENAALREDKERLDWLDESGAEVYKCGNSEDGSVLFFVDTDPSTVFSADTLRAAIDAARKKAQP